MEKLQLSLLIFQVIVAIEMIILVLFQKSDGDSLGGIGGGNGGSNAVISSRASASLITRITMILAGIFMINCLVLASLSNSSKKAIQSEKDGVKSKSSTPSAPKVD